MAPDFPNLMKNINLHIQESQQTPRRINMDRFTLRHIVVTLLKDREKSWKQQEKFIAPNSYIRKKGKSQENHVSSHFRIL